jgi:L-ascorbate metabolism protein UlaG (beta-lactamase superfamily)
VNERTHLEHPENRLGKAIRHKWRCGLLVWTLLVLLASGCGAGAPATAPPQPPAERLVEAATPTPAPVEEPASGEELPALLAHLHALGHASFRLDGPPTIYFDPTSAGSKALPADLILISHEHNDHYHPATLKQISTPQTVILTNERVGAKLAGVQGVEGEVRVMQAGDVETLGEVEIEAVPAYNLTTSYHPREAGGLGFVVTWGGERLYFAGDTDHIPEMAEIECDVALLPIGGKYTMDVEEAAQAAATIGPRVAVPMHERSADPEQFRSLCDCTVVLLEP